MNENENMGQNIVIGKKMSARKQNNESNKTRKMRNTPVFCCQKYGPICVKTKTTSWANRISLSVA